LTLAFFTYIIDFDFDNYAVRATLALLLSSSGCVNDQVLGTLIRPFDVNTLYLTRYSKSLSLVNIVFIIGADLAIVSYPALVPTRCLSRHSFSIKSYTSALVSSMLSTA
jgi:hypothetical protein